MTITINEMRMGTLYCPCEITEPMITLWNDILLQSDVGVLKSWSLVSTNKH